MFDVIVPFRSGTSPGCSPFYSESSGHRPRIRARRAQTILKSSTVIQSIQDFAIKFVHWLDVTVPVCPGRHVTVSM